MEIEFYWKNILKTLLLMLVGVIILQFIMNLLGAPYWVYLMLCAYMGYKIGDVEPWRMFGYKDDEVGH